MRRLNHSNVSKLEGVYETENSIYVILEYLEGKQLNEILKVLLSTLRAKRKLRAARPGRSSSTSLEESTTSTSTG